MATKDLLTDPAFYEELETNQKHADFLSEQLRKARNEVQITLEMLQSGQLSGEEGANIIRTLQSGLVEKLKDLDDVTRKTQVLLGLPNVESDAVEVNQLEVDKLGANPILDEGTRFGILERVPKVMVVGDRKVLLSPNDSAMMMENVDETAKTLGEPDETQNGDQIKDIDKELQAKDKILAHLETQLKAKQAQLDQLRKKNKVLRTTMNELLGEDFDEFTGDLPTTEEAADKYLQVVQNEREKIEKLVEKVKQESRQQQRANQLLANGRILPEEDTENCLENADQSRIYDIDAERSLNKELLAYEQAKKERKRKTEELDQLKNDIENLVDKSDDTKDELERVEQKVKALKEIMDEIRETEELEVELSVVEKELYRAHENVSELKKKEEHLDELLHRQECELNSYRDKFIDAQEKYEACAVVIREEQEACKRREEQVRDDIECFQANMENKLSMYRALPFALGVTLIQNLHVEETLHAVIQHNTLLARDITHYSDKTEDLLQQLKQHETRAMEYKARQLKVDRLRDKYEKTEHILNKHRKNIAVLNEELGEKENKIEDRTKEIEEVRKVIEELREEYAMRNFVLQQEHEIEKMAQIAELNNLEMDIAKTRGRIRAERMIMLHEDVK